jgi:LysM repeat protein
MRRLVLVLLLAFALGGCGLSSDTSLAPQPAIGGGLAVSPEAVETPAATATPTVGPIVHVVQSGETLWDIATHYSIAIDKIIAANNIDNPDRIQVGQQLVIPLGEYVGPVNQATAEAAPTFTPIVDGQYRFVVWVETVAPFQTGRETIYVQLTSYDVGVRGCQMYAIVHFSSGDVRLAPSQVTDGSGTAKVEFPVKNGEIGVSVLADVFLDNSNRSFHAQTAFTPR